jgi:hypothetical protein
LFFYKYFYVGTIWISTKPCITSAEGMNSYMDKYTYIYICDSLLIAQDTEGAVEGSCKNVMNLRVTWRSMNYLRNSTSNSLYEQRNGNEFLLHWGRC